MDAVVKPAFKVERATRASRVGLAFACAAFAVLVSLPFWGESSWLRLFAEFACFLVLAQMWNLLAGYGGMVSVGQQAFIGLGGYGLVVLANHTGDQSVRLCAAGGAARCTARGADGGDRVPPARRLLRDRHVGGRRGLSVVDRQCVGARRGIGHQSDGVARHPESHTRVDHVLDRRGIGVRVHGTGVLAVALAQGLALTAIRDSEVAAASQGVEVRSVKYLVYVIAAFGCGLAGALYFLSNLRISPDAAFGVNWSAFVIFIVVIGGIGTIEGPIVGTILYFVLRELFGDFGTWYLMTLGLVAIVVMVKFPKGLWGFVAQRFDLRFFPVQRRVRRIE